MKEAINIIKARENHADEICSLINTAYRGDLGWTKETNIVSGERTNTNDVVALLNKTNSHMFIATQKNIIIACICIETKDNQAYISSFAVSPSYQNCELGKQVLNFAENFAIKQLGVHKLLMVVISQRMELIEFYERRGYKRTGKIENYPAHLNVGKPLIEGITVEQLEKNT